MADYMKIPEVGQLLGLSEKTVRRRVKAGEIPSVFIGGVYRISRADLDEYLQLARVRPGKASAPPSQERLFDGITEQQRRALDRIEEFCNQLQAVVNAGKLDDPIIATVLRGRIVDFGSMIPALYEIESVRAALHPLAIRFLELAKQLADKAEGSDTPSDASELTATPEYTRNVIDAADRFMRRAS